MTQQPPNPQRPYGQPPQQPAGPPQQYGPPPQQYGGPPQQPYGQQSPYGAAQQYAQPFLAQQPYGAPVAAPKAPISQGARAWGWIAAVAGVLAIIGCFGVWVSVDAGLFGHISMNGYGQISGPLSQSSDDVKDGVLVTVFAVVVITFGVLRGLGKLALTCAIVTLVLGLLNLAISIYDVSDVTDTFAGSSVGWGLWLCLVTSIAMCVAGLVGIIKRR